MISQRCGLIRPRPSPLLHVTHNNNLIYGLLSFQLAATTSGLLPPPAALTLWGVKGLFSPGILLKKSQLLLTPRAPGNSRLWEKSSSLGTRLA